MIQLFFIIALAYIGYIFIIKPIIIRPFNEGMDEKRGNIPKKRTVSAEISKEKGLKFEQNIVKKFDKAYFTLKEWRGDKIIDGLYAESNLNPDLVLEFRLNNFSTIFALECKYRKNLYNGAIELAMERQIRHYKKFEREKEIPVYIALGLGGNPDNPTELFLIPLKHLSSNKISYNYLSKFKKKTKEQFYFKIQDQELY